jgi:transcriptional regulator with XRE-family HTH domain
MAIPKGALRSYRAKSKRTTAEVAAQLEIAESTLRSYENGTRQVDAEMAVKIERILGIDRVLLRPDIFRKQQRIA